MAKKDGAAGGFNTPFGKLRQLAKQAATPAVAPARLPPPTRTEGNTGGKTTGTTPALPKPAIGGGKLPTASDDDRYFEQAMRGTTKLGDAERGKRASPVRRDGAGPEAPRRTTATRAAAARDDEADALAELAEMVTDGAGQTTGGRAPDVAAKLLKDLRRGAYPIEADLDLHGRSRAEAQPQLHRFVVQSSEQGRRCVRVIHGRGLHSNDEGPVLRDAVHRALAAGGPDGRAVLAFTLAPPAQGGDGATLVLLRKKKTASE
jgi:DNA-nicking Smr family endonuclease